MASVFTRPGWTVSIPSLKDPRIMIATALTIWTLFGQTVYYFNRNPQQIGLTLLTCCAIDVILTAILYRQLLVPLSAYITGLSLSLLLESFDWRVYVVAGAWSVLSKYLLRDRDRHFFNPSNFGIVLSLLLLPHIASIAPGSQWGADYRIAFVILCLGMLLMRRVKRLDLALAWMSGYVVMGLVRMALGQGGLVFVLGPMTGAEFALFTFSMMPDPKASPPTARGRIAWGISIAVVDGILRYFEIRYSPFYSLFGHCALLPAMRWAAARARLDETDPWRVLVHRLGSGKRGAPVAAPPAQPVGESPALPGVTR